MMQIPPLKTQKDSIFLKGLSIAVRSPWLLLTIPLLVGGIWLVLHPGIITDNIDKPYALLAGPALVGSALLGWLLIAFFKSIIAGLRFAGSGLYAWMQKDESTFWLVIAIFLIVSVSESGPYFDELLGSSDLYGSLGYLSAFVIDLVAIECMRARLRASRMHDQGGMRLYLSLVIACASLSSFSNTYTALRQFVAPTNSLIPIWMIHMAPWTGMAFPLLIVFLSFTADYTANKTSSKLDPEEYKTADSNSNKLLEYHLEGLRTRKAYLREIAALNGQPFGRTFRPWNWIFPQNQPDMAAVIEQVKGQVKQLDEEAIKKSILSVLQPEFERLSTRVLQQENKGNSEHITLQTIAANVASMTKVIQEIQGSYTGLMQEITQVKTSLEEGRIEQNKVLESDPEEEEEEENMTPIKGEKKAPIWANDPTLNDLAIRYPIVKSWQAQGRSTISLVEIIEGTKHSHQMIARRVNDGTFAKTKKRNLFRIDSVIRWLKVAPLPVTNEGEKGSENKGVSSQTTGELPVVKSTNASGNGHTKGPVILEELAHL